MTLSDKARHCSSLPVKMLLFALFVVCGVCGVSNSARAEEIVRGTFTLNEETRFGATLLPAGHYLVSIEPITSMTAVGRVSVFVRPESKSGPVASVFAMAWQQGCEGTTHGITLLSDR